MSGFPPITDVRAVEDALTQRRDHYRRAVRDGLDKLASCDLVQTVTEIVERATGNGVRHAPRLVEDVVDAFEVEAQRFLEEEEKNIEKVVSALLAAASRGAVNDTARLVDRLEAVVKNWDSVAQPVQVAAMSKGKDHEHSQRVALKLRNAAITLNNEHGMLQHAKRITDLLKTAFVEVPRVLELVEKDAKAIAGILKDRQENAAAARRWEEAIAFEFDLGVVFKDKFRLSKEGIEWKNARFPLESITRLRWGGVRRWVNGIPTGTDFTVGFGDSSRWASVAMHDDALFSQLTEKLFRAIGVRILVEMLKAVGRGERLAFRDAILDDFGVELPRRKFFGDERVHVPWQSLRSFSRDGCFVMQHRTESNVGTALSYMDVDNVHFLEAAISKFFATPGARLSSLLSDGD